MPAVSPDKHPTHSCHRDGPVCFAALSELGGLSTAGGRWWDPGHIQDFRRRAATVGLKTSTGNPAGL